MWVTDQKNGFDRLTTNRFYRRIPLNCFLSFFFFFFFALFFLGGGGSVRVVLNRPFLFISGNAEGKGQRNGAQTPMASSPFFLLLVLSLRVASLITNAWCERVTERNDGAAGNLLPIFTRATRHDIALADAVSGDQSGASSGFVSLCFFSFFCCFRHRHRRRGLFLRHDRRLAADYWRRFQWPMRSLCRADCSWRKLYFVVFSSGGFRHRTPLGSISATNQSPVLSWLQLIKFSLWRVPRVLPFWYTACFFCPVSDWLAYLLKTVSATNQGLFKSWLQGYLMPNFYGVSALAHHHMFPLHGLWLARNYWERNQQPIRTSYWFGDSVVGGWWERFVSDQSEVGIAIQWVPKVSLFFLTCTFFFRPRCTAARTPGTPGSLRPLAKSRTLDGGTARCCPLHAGPSALNISRGVGVATPATSSATSLLILSPHPLSLSRARARGLASTSVNGLPYLFDSFLFACVSEGVVVLSWNEQLFLRLGGRCFHRPVFFLVVVVVVAFL